jgi:hypothetical protein
VPQGLFKDCINLTNVTFSDGIVGINENAFEGCTGLTSIEMPTTLQYISKEAFKGCTQLTKIDLKSRISMIGEGAFGGCTKLETFTVDKANTKYSSKDGILYNKKQTKILLYPAGKTGKVTFASGVKTIGENAFQGCSSLTEITIPDRITGIDEGAFKDCIGLKKIQMSEALTTIKSNVFENCIGLTKVEIPGYVNRVESGAFKGCGNITEMVIPQSVKRIERDAFEDCDKLVLYGDDKSYGQRFAQGNNYGFIEIVTNPPKVLLSVKSKTKRIASLSWKRAVNSNGYIIQMSTKKKGGFKTISTIKGEKKLKLSRGSLKSKKTYYFRARSYKTVEKKTIYGKYSDVISVKVK